MSEKITSISPEQMKDNPFKLTGTDWFLLTAGTLESFNMLTAGWGGFGVLWDRNVCYTFVRQTRYTYEFIEKNDLFTMSFFPEDYKKALAFCGANSGRDVNKVEKTGLTPVALDSGAVYFEEARMVIECRKIYHQDIDPNNFHISDIHDFYGLNDFHRMYVGEIKEMRVSG